MTLTHRRDQLRAEPILIDGLMAKAQEGKVEILWNHRLEEVLGNEGGVTDIKIRHIRDDTEARLAVHGVFIAIGHKPNTAIFEGQLEMRNGYVLTQGGNAGMNTVTSVPGVFAAGDVQDQIYRQAITSAGTGCMAALDAQRYLESIEHQVVAKVTEGKALEGRADFIPGIA